jgi:tight adherence protein C
MLGSIIGLILGLITFGLFSLLPFVYISDSIRRRHGRVRKELPFALDLLTLSVEAGMDFTAALGNIVDRLRKSPLAQEFDQTVKEINIGKQRSDALRDMARRIAMSEVNSVVSALIQADQLGSGLGEVLRIQAEDVRMRRFQNAEKRASEVPVKMLFPLVAFIFPVTFIIIAAPLVIRFLRIWLGGLG